MEILWSATVSAMIISLILAWVMAVISQECEHSLSAPGTQRISRERVAAIGATLLFFVAAFLGSSLYVYRIQDYKFDSVQEYSDCVYKNSKGDQKHLSEKLIKTCFGDSTLRATKERLNK